MSVISAQGLTKKYGSTTAVDNVSFSIEPGRIVGLVGPNGAGKTSLLSALLGLTAYDGNLTVCGLDPYKQRHELMKQVCFVADVAVLPRWIKVHELLEYVAGVHPNFNREQAEGYLKDTKIKMDAKVKSLSKGMVVQLHLAVVMAIDAKLLVLDEPTLGLDILFRKRFYEQLLTDYFDHDKTVIITTHQVEEIENLLSDIMFIRDGQLVLTESMEQVSERYFELEVRKDNQAEAEALGPVHTREVLGRKVYLFADTDRSAVEHLGEVHQPSIADLFVALMKGVEL